MLAFDMVGAFRWSELVPLRMEDALLVPKGLHVLVRRSKIDQGGTDAISNGRAAAQEVGRAVGGQGWDRGGRPAPPADQGGPAHRESNVGPRRGCVGQGARRSENTLRCAVSGVVGHHRACHASQIAPMGIAQATKAIKGMNNRERPSVASSSGNGAVVASSLPDRGGLNTPTAELMTLRLHG